MIDHITDDDFDDLLVNLFFNLLRSTVWKLVREEMRIVVVWKNV